jgi:hypothetical protein|tara:strand:- start:221 stop:445 length:225 start_codon:yes stop_codon:yes gene_type:complete
MNKNLDQRKFLREKEVSEIYGINPNTLRRQRWGDYGIPYSVVGRAKNKKKGGIVLYSILDIEAAMDKRTPTVKL